MRRKVRILDFDCECRPLAWYGGDWVTKQPTCIAWKFIGERGKVEHYAIGKGIPNDEIENDERHMIELFREAYNAADIVTGHYIRGFDLPLLTGALIRLGGAPLEDKLAQDTKGDLVKAQGLSKSQENLGAMFELDHPKIPMNTTKWARANMLMSDGIALTEKRCVGDVAQHIELREHMLSRGLLRAPSKWSANAVGRGEPYSA